MPKFTIKDLIKEPHKGYANFEGENRIFMMFTTISPKMAKLKEGDKFMYKSEMYASEIYQVVMRIPRDIDHPKNIQLNCLKESTINAEADYKTK